VTEDHEQQDRTEQRGTTARPVTAAARRERRAATRRGVEDRAPASRATEGTRPRRPRPADDNGPKTQSKSEQGIATPKRDRQEKRPGLFSRFFRFVREVIAELRKVIWPTRKQQLTYTVVVLVFLAVVVAFVSGLDLLFAKGVFWIFA